jgi:hypothetical protein
MLVVDSVVSPKVKVLLKKETNGLTQRNVSGCSSHSNEKPEHIGVPREPQVATIT